MVSDHNHRIINGMPYGAGANDTSAFLLLLNDGDWPATNS
jgi:hypothetical protein